MTRVGVPLREVMNTRRLDESFLGDIASWLLTRPDLWRQPFAGVPIFVGVRDRVVSFWLSADGYVEALGLPVSELEELLDDIAQGLQPQQWYSKLSLGREPARWLSEPSLLVKEWLTRIASTRNLELHCVQRSPILVLVRQDRQTIVFFDLGNGDVECVFSPLVVGGYYEFWLGDRLQWKGRLLRLINLFSADRLRWRRDGFLVTSDGEVISRAEPGLPYLNAEECMFRY